MVVFVVLVVTLAMAVFNLSYLATVPRNNLESLFEKKYMNSDQLKEDVSMALNDIVWFLEEDRDAQLRQRSVPYLYYVTDGMRVASNVATPDEQLFTQYKHSYFIFKNNHETMAFPFRYFSEYAGVIADFSDKYVNQAQIMLAFPDAMLAVKQQQWEKTRAELVFHLWRFAFWAVVSGALLLYLFAHLSKTSVDDHFQVRWYTRIFTEIMLAIWWVSGVAIVSNFFLPYRSFYSSVELFFPLAVILATTMVLYVKIRTGTFRSQMIVYKMYDAMCVIFEIRPFKNYAPTKKLFVRQLIFIVLSMLIVVAIIGSGSARDNIFILLCIEAALIYWYLRANRRTFIEINHGLAESVEDQIKSERMKIALVTNVSHDLKTPLTSIISYVDLLSKEEQLSDVAQDYVTILKEKAERLKNIVADLFELAKSSSGDIQVDMERLDIKKLLEQTLANLDDDIQKAGFAFKIKLPEQPVYIESDGKKLYRVLQNVLDNALKYSLQGSRIHVEMVSTPQGVIVDIKNTANYEMDFSEEEILQRFFRGDKSRATEGSGLGLSIAESFTNVCGGKFTVSIDGDLFKVRMTFYEA